MLEWGWTGSSWVAYGHPRPDNLDARMEFRIRVNEFGYFDLSQDGQVISTEGSLGAARRWADKCNVRSDYVLAKSDDTARLKALVKQVRGILAKALQDTSPQDTLDTMSDELYEIHALLLEEENR